MFFNSETSLVLARRNYKVYPNLEFTRRATTHYPVILGTGAGSSFIQKDVIPQLQWFRIKHPRSDVRTRGAGKLHVNISGTCDLSVELGIRLATVKFYVVDKLRYYVILGCDFCCMHVKAISPLQRVRELDDSPTVVIVIRDVLTRGKAKVPIPEAQVYAKPTIRSTDKILTSTKTLLEPEIQTCIKVKTVQAGLIMFEPLPSLYGKHNCLAGAGV